MLKHQVHLNQQQRQHLLDITSKGKVAVLQFKRSQILLLSDQGYKDQEITERVGVSLATVEAVVSSYSLLMTFVADYYFRNWRKDGTWVKIHDRLGQWTRIANERAASPSQAIVDTHTNSLYK